MTMTMINIIIILAFQVIYYHINNRYIRIFEYINFEYQLLIISIWFLFKSYLNFVHIIEFHDMTLKKGLVYLCIQSTKKCVKNQGP